MGSRFVQSRLIAWRRPPEGKSTAYNIYALWLLLSKKGWRLSPLFDVNPNPYGGESALDKGDLFADAAYYRLTTPEAETKFLEMKTALADWHKRMPLSFSRLAKASENKHA